MKYQKVTLDAKIGSLIAHFWHNLNVQECVIFSEINNIKNNF